jgi:hypothetical protein
MNEAELNKLRGFYHSIIGQQQVLMNLKLSGPPENCPKSTVFPLLEEFKQVNAEFPKLIEPFADGAYSGFTSGPHGQPQKYYNLPGVLTYASALLGRIKVLIAEPSNTPVTESRDFSFINDPKIKKIVDRDYDEIQRAYISNCWKSVIILCGGAIEAILMDLLSSRDEEAKQAESAPNKLDISTWDLSELINVSVELKWVKEGVGKLSHPLREYRNLVHPGNEIRNKLQFDAEEAKISLEVLNMLHRDLTQ